MKLNREWHLANKMPVKATLDQRISWHLEHARNCSCRDIPEKLKTEIKKRALNLAKAEAKPTKNISRSK